MTYRVGERIARISLAASAAAIAFGISAAVIAARSAGWLEGLELAAADHFVSISPRGSDESPNVALVYVTDSDVQELGAYPIPDAHLGRAIEVLMADGARVVGIDIYRDMSVPPGSDRLAQVLTGHANVIAPYRFADADGQGVKPPRVLAAQPQRLGFTNIVMDPGGIVRRGLLYADDGEGGVGTSLALQLALLHLHEQGIHPQPDPDDPMVLALGAARFAPLDAGFGGYAEVDAGGFQYPLDFRESPAELPHARLADLLAGRFGRGTFDGRMVLIGALSTDVLDRFHTPLPSLPTTANEAGIPGAELHARIADQIVRLALGQAMPRRAIADAAVALLVVLFAAVSAAGMLRLSASWQHLTFGLGGLAALWALAALGQLQGFWVPVVPAGIAWVGTLSLVGLHGRSRERMERAELMQLFSRHVTKQVADDVWEHRDEFLDGGRPKPVRLTATILFADVKGYSGTAEKLEPAELMEWIDTFLRAMANEVLERGGVVEDYFGDGMMACFGIPIPRTEPDAIRADANAAVVSALGMAQALTRLNAEWRSEGRPGIGIRVGICTGAVVAGSMGSADRLKYGVVGDAVVTAQRLESLDRIEHDFEREPARILLTNSTIAQLDGFRTECVGDFVLKGKDEPVTVNRLLGREIETESGGRG